MPSKKHIAIDGLFKKDAIQEEMKKKCGEEDIDDFIDT